MLRGAVGASVTPLRDGGAALDDAAFAAVVDDLVHAGMDGVLAFGTNGEGVLLHVDERRHGLELFVAAGGGRLARAPALGRPAPSGRGARLAWLAPPRYARAEPAQLAHFAAAAEACAPLPFYVYEFERTSGYAVTPATVARLADRAPNLAGMKVSDTPWASFAPYLIEGLDIFVGPEALIHLGLTGGAVGAVSALA